VTAQVKMFATPAPERLFKPHGVAIGGITLRPYQENALRSIKQEFVENRTTLYVAATGTGKTTVFGALAKDWPGRVLVLAHRDELIQQSAQRLRAMTGEPVDIDKAESIGGHSRLTVASIQTLCRESRLHRYSRNHFGLVIVDEAHHCPAKSYAGVLNYFDAKVLGVTATPDRSDRLALGKIFESVAMVYDIADAINDGWLVPIVPMKVDVDVDLSGIKTTAGDLNQGELDEAMGRVLEGVARPTFALAERRQTVVFTTSVSNAHKMADIFNELRAGCSRAVDGGMDMYDRRKVLEDYAKGEFQFLVNVQIATEGWDDPATSCVAIGRPTKSRALYTQMIGRGLRPHPGTTDCLVLDFAGNAGKHALVSPLDVLAGKYTDEEVSFAKEILSKKPDAKQRAEVILEEARAKLKEIKERASRKVKYTATRFDAFEILGVRRDDKDKMDWQFGRKDPTDKQLATLEKFGINPKGLSKSQASALIGASIDRIKAGKASYKQMRSLAKNGIDNPNLSRKVASALMDAIARNGWRPLPAGRAQEIINAR